MADAKTYVVLVFGVAGDGGGVVWDGHRLRRIPPWNPQIRAALQAAEGLFAASSRISIKDAGARVDAVADEILTPVMPKIAKAIEAAAK